MSPKRRGFTALESNDDLRYCSAHLSTPREDWSQENPRWALFMRGEKETLRMIDRRLSNLKEYTSRLLLHNFESPIAHPVAL